jgi:hypothetical protein
MFLTISRIGFDSSNLKCETNHKLQRHLVISTTKKSKEINIYIYIHHDFFGGGKVPIWCHCLVKIISTTILQIKFNILIFQVKFPIASSMQLDASGLRTAATSFYYFWIATSPVENSGPEFPINKQFMNLWKF